MEASRGTTRTRPPTVLVVLVVSLECAAAAVTRAPCSANAPSSAVRACRSRSHCHVRRAPRAQIRRAEEARHGCSQSLGAIVSRQMQAAQRWLKARETPREACDRLAVKFEDQPCAECGSADGARDGLAPLFVLLISRDSS